LNTLFPYNSYFPKQDTTGYAKGAYVIGKCFGISTAFVNAYF